MMRVVSIPGSLALCAALLVAVPAAAATLTVDSTADESAGSGANGTCTLREAISAANGNVAVDGCPAGSAGVTDVIEVPYGIYSLSLAGAGEEANLTGDLDITESVIVRGVVPAGVTGGSADGGRSVDRAEIGRLMAGGERAAEQWQSH